MFKNHDNQSSTLKILPKVTVNIYKSLLRGLIIQKFKNHTWLGKCVFLLWFKWLKYYKESIMTTKCFILSANTENTGKVL